MSHHIEKRNGERRDFKKLKKLNDKDGNFVTAMSCERIIFNEMNAIIRVT
jgi:hypothetical protein